MREELSGNSSARCLGGVAVKKEMGKGRGKFWGRVRAQAEIRL